VNINAAVCNEERLVTFLDVGDIPATSGIEDFMSSSFRDAAHSRSSVSEQARYSVRCMPLKQLLQGIRKVRKHVQLQSRPIRAASHNCNPSNAQLQVVFFLDVEGPELSVLEGVDFTRFSSITLSLRPKASIRRKTMRYANFSSQRASATLAESARIETTSSKESKAVYTCMCYH
jgi:hypothetical protein